MSTPNDRPDSSATIETFSASFAHDISTPLATAQMNADLLLEYIDTIAKSFDSEGEATPENIKLAILRAPKLIHNNLANISQALSQYKAFLNDQATAGEDEDETGAADDHQTLTERALKILLVDDEDIHHDIGDAVLSSLHQVYHEMNGENAISRCRQEDFDVILMDMQMPVLPGPQTTQKLREFIPSSTMIIGLSNMPIQSKKNDLRECGFNGFLEKPLKLENFQQLISRLSQV